MVGKLQNYNLWIIYLISTTILMKRNQKRFHKIFHECHRFTKYLPIPYINQIKKIQVEFFLFLSFYCFCFSRQFLSVGLAAMEHTEIYLPLPSCSGIKVHYHHCPAHLNILILNKIFLVRLFLSFHFI